MTGLAQRAPGELADADADVNADAIANSHANSNSHATANSHANSTRTVDRALALLAEVCAEESITLSECARRAGLPASTALRLLRTLAGSAFVDRDELGSFRAGARLIQLGAAALGRQSIVRLAEPGLQRLVAATSESAYLAVPGPEGTAMYIAMVEGTHAIRHTSWVGRAFPTAGLAVGRALADEVGPAGYTAERDRLEPDVTAIVAAIGRPGGGTCAALSLLGPTYRIDDEKLQRFGRIAAHEARLVTAQLGGPTHTAGATRQETGS